MFTISCRQLGFADCDFVATGQTRHHTKTLVLDHINYEHHDYYADRTRAWVNDFEKKVDAHISEAGLEPSGRPEQACQEFSVSCKALGFADCDFVATGNTRHHTMLVVLEHFNYEHHELYAGRDSSWRNDFEQMVDTHIKEAAA
jgi:predicted small metal-binding protein